MSDRPERRYSTTDVWTAQDGDPRPFRGLKPREVTTLLGYVEHELAPGDRLEMLAQDYLGDPRLWWAIAQANPQVIFPADLIYRDMTGRVDDAGLAIPAPEQVPVPALGTIPAHAGIRIRIPRRPDTPTG